MGVNPIVSNFEVTVEKLIYGGDGLARLDGRVGTIQKGSQTSRLSHSDASDASQTITKVSITALTRLPCGTRKRPGDPPPEAMNSSNERGIVLTS